jgi:hypothetical protein
MAYAFSFSESPPHHNGPTRREDSSWGVLPRLGELCLVLQAASSKLRNVREGG